jgi:glutathione S-transferase
MITLYHRPQTRSSSIVWLLYELDVPYETKNVTSIRSADGSGAVDPANPHPHGKVPALTDGDETVFESGAIAVYLADKYRTKKLAPAATDPKRGEYLSWMFYRPGVMEPAFLERRLNIKHVYGMMGWAPPEEVEEVMNGHLAKNKYLLGDEFSAADIVLGGGLNFMVMFKMATETPVLKEYFARITDRPAFRRTMALDSPK